MRKHLKDWWPLYALILIAIQQAFDCYARSRFGALVCLLAWAATLTWMTTDKLKRNRKNKN